MPQPVALPRMALFIAGHNNCLAVLSGTHFDAQTRARPISVLHCISLQYTGFRIGPDRASQFVMNRRD